MLYKSITYVSWHDSIMYICVSLAKSGLRQSINLGVSDHEYLSRERI